MKKSINHIYLIVLLAILSSVAPMGVDIYLPSIVHISHYFDTPIKNVELSLSIFLIGFAIGQVFGGAISDRYGRRLSSILGLLLFGLFSVLIVFSGSIYELWFWRLFQAFSGGITVVNATAAVRDRFSGAEAAKVFSLVGLVRSIIPLLAPVFGAAIIHFFTWKEVFIFLAIYAWVVAFFVYKDLPESFTRTKSKIVQSYKLVLTHKMALRAMLALALSFGGFFIIIAKTSFIYIEHFGISTDLFPLFFGINFVVMMFMIRVNVKLLKSSRAITITRAAVLVQIAASVLFLSFYDSIGIVGVIFVLATYMSMMAFIFGNAMAMALEFFPNNAGVASGVIGVLQFGLGSIISSIALSFEDYTFFTIAISLLVVSTLSFLSLFGYKDR